MIIISLVKMPQAVPSVIRCCCDVSPESPVFWRLSGLLLLLSVGPGSCTVVDVGPSPAASDKTHTPGASSG
jgi:hypothetical protein